MAGVYIIGMLVQGKPVAPALLLLYVLYVVLDNVGQDLPVLHAFMEACEADNPLSICNIPGLAMPGFNVAGWSLQHTLEAHVRWDLCTAVPLRASCLSQA